MSLSYINSPLYPAPVTLVSYDGIEARVVRGDLQCTNGYIHLIDRVIIKVSYLTSSKYSQT